MLDNKQWEVRRKEVIELEKQRRELKGQKNKQEELKEVSRKIHKLQVAINQHKKHEEHKVRMDTITYKMFGKPLKELTKEEYALYQSRRERRKRKLQGELI